MNSKRNEIIREIKRKDVILFGAGNFASQFYRDFKDELHIVGCITNNNSEHVFNVDGEDICEIKRVDGIKKSDSRIIIVCVEMNRPIEKQLSAMGLVNGVDFISSGVFRTICSDKKIALIYGVCYVRAIYTCLQSSRAFTDIYDSFFWTEYLKMGAIDKELYSFILSICDLYIYNAFLTTEKIRLNNAYFSLLNSSCIKIGIPSITFNGYHPRRKGFTGDVNKYSITSAATPYAPFMVPDEEINCMIEEKKDVNEIKKIISDVDFYECGWLEENYKKEIAKLKISEKMSDLKITDFLVEQHKKKRLVLNETHMSNEVIIELADRVLEKLELPRDVTDNMHYTRLLYTSEIPIYPSVIEHMDLTVYKNNPRYCLYTFTGDLMLTFDEYVERYYEYCIMMKKCIEYGYFPS